MRKVNDTMKILTINPGSTSTKIAVFEDGQTLYSANVSHDASELAKYASISDQLPYRERTIRALLAENGVNLDGTAAVVGRGGGLIAMEGGVYAVDALLLDHAAKGANGVQHPAQLGPQLARTFSGELGCPAFVVNPPDTDELQDVARMTGIRGVYRNVHLHALNLKETAIRHAQGMGRQYEDCNFVVCHIGGGVSVSAHRKGRMIDGCDIVGGEGPMAPTRCGAVPASALIDYCFSGVDKKTAKALCTKTGGFVSLLGTADAIQVSERAAGGERLAWLAWNGMIYQIVKEIGAMAAALHGQVDGILLGGGMVHNKDLVAQITGACSFIAPVSAYPGEFEMEAMAAGALRALKGEEAVRQYTGVSVFQAFKALTR
ncbi:MAG: butyrate kinase [Oscillospiraceae bacterium]|nr:butyrate kinase [Oscillospiraceae bacterium]